MRPASLALVLTALSSGCAAGLECTAHGGQVWRELRSPHFVVQTNLPSAKAREEVEKMERTRDAIALFFELPPADDNLRVVMVSDVAQLREFTQGDYAGWATRSSSEGVQTIVTSLPSGLETHTHELAHYFSAFRRARLPRWLEEGQATYFETTQLLPNRRAKVGLAQEHRRNSAFALGLVSFEDLWKWDRADDVSDFQLGRMYATSWAWVHFLMNEERPRLQQVIAKLQQNVPPREAFDQVFSAVEQLQLIDRVEKYVDGTTYHSLTVQLPPTGAIRSERELTAAQVHLLRAGLWKAPQPRDNAQTRAVGDLAAAEVLDPTAFEVQLQRARVAGTALGLVERFPLRAEAQLAAANALGNPKDLQLQLQYAEKAVELDPGSALAQLVYASALMKAGRADDALRPALESERLAPWNPNAQFTLAALAAVGKHCEEVTLRLAHGRALVGERLTERDRGFLTEEAERLGKACRE